ncbi:MAG: hypothetical protein CVV59_02145, partial [Tenericutes bacterium HGW-Tenericutes-4]
MKINGKKIKPIIKNVFRKTIKAALVTGLVFSSVVGGYNAGREVYEEFKGDNHIIDFDMGFGSLVLHNKDKRNAMQIFDDAKQAALNVEGLEDAYRNGGSWTIEQKKEFLKKFSKEIAESAGIKIKEVMFVPREQIDGANGMYTGLNNKYIAFSRNKIFICEELLDLSSMEEVLKTDFHEIIHFIEG